jgi:D-alanyl-D-alanine carboxypeptidase
VPTRAVTRAATPFRTAGPRSRRVAVVSAGALAVTLLVLMTAIVIAVGGTRDSASGAAPSAAALAEIPAEALAAYQDAGAAWRVDWAILAGIGLKECRHGTYRAPGCNPGTVNAAGARGWMQFIGSTWRRGLAPHALEPRTSPPARDGQGFATDGDGDGDTDPWSWPDATHSAARYLVHLGINHNRRRALLGYNHDPGYVDRVLGAAARYRATPAPGDSIPITAGDIPLVTVEGITVRADITDQVGALVRAARADGHILAGSGYRDPARQIALRRQHCGTSGYAIYQMPPSRCSPPTARPGTSLHERGLAVDFSCAGALIRSRTHPCYRWLAAHAADHGLYNLPSEPWHWSTTGG